MFARPALSTGFCGCYKSVSLLYLYLYDLIAGSNLYVRTPQKSLEAFKASASQAPENLSPGETPSAPTRVPTQPSSPNGFNFTDADNGHPVKNVGAIVGGVLGGVIFLVILVTLAVFLVMRRKGREGENDGGSGAGSDS